MNDVAEWEAIHQSRHWGTYPDIHVVRQVHKFCAAWAETIKHVPFQVYPKALDIGCGSKSALQRMTKRGIFVDAMIADAENVDFPAESFDFILDNFTLTNIQNPPWERIMSWLKPGGWLIHASFEKAPNGTPMTWEHTAPGSAVERHSSWVEGNAFTFVVRKYVKPS